MSVVQNAGYQDIRDYIQANWKYIELRDEEQDPVLRIGIEDPRVTWTHTTGAQTLEMTCVIKGSDSDVASLLPQTFAGAALFKVASGGSAMSAEVFTNFTMSSASDQLTIVYQLEVPEVPQDS